MTTTEFVGLALIGVAAFHLVPAIATGTIPSNWPVRPLTGEAKPTQYRITFGVFAVAGLLGIALLLASLAHRLLD
ncbi:hypothetical protein [Sphingomonas sp. KR3-1]|uniref:hypothetical protein n=1 Tax=Sphingomonas sp. KR3-1 TaxID=3156611 RepID=UPI0032B53E5B